MISDQPVNEVIWVPIEKVVANDYNPNSVASAEMRLLYISIKNDGYTQPIVTIYDEKKDVYVIVDGFHRYAVMKRYKDIYLKCEGKLPIVVLKNKSLDDRMAATIRHNRARGKHSVNGMSNIVMEMLLNGKSDSDICNELGLEPEELVRLKYITGYAKLYIDKEYSKAKYSEKQVEEMNKYKEGLGNEQQ